MISNNTHIISACQWDTSFDSKEMGAALQGRLSNWSNLKMPGEIGDIFDKICPPEQVWKIQSLTIDLGQINLDELESELSFRLRKQLKKKLTDLLLYRKQENNVIEILDEEVLYIELLSYFFQYGLIPWKYKDLDSSVNHVLAVQLQKNRQMVVSMFREIGSMHVDVRKRIAWQATEANIIRIIEGLEPNNAKQVISFSAEMALIQAKASIIQASITDFRKNVWFWILNYLLAELGSIFNKIAFVKSSLTQMAAHYHISYTELIGMIGQAIRKVKEHNVIKEDILLTLNILVNENINHDLKNKNKRPGTDICLEIKNYFSTQGIPGHLYSSAELSDMVLGIASNKEFNFREHLLIFKDKEKLLAEKLSGLNEDSLEAIFLSLTGDRAVIDKQDIHFLYNVCRQLEVRQRILWESAIKFIVANKGAANTKKNFLYRLLATLAGDDRASRLSVLEHMLCANVAPGGKSLSSLEIYTELSTIFAEEISGDNRAVTIKRFRALLDMLGQQVQRNAIEKPVFISLRKPVVQYIRLNPATAFRVLVAYRNKRTLKKMLPYLLDELLTGLLMRNAKNEAAETLLSLNDVLQKEGASFAIWIEKAVTQVGLDVILCEPAANAKVDLERLLEKISLSVPARQLEHFFDLLEKWLGNSKLPGSLITIEFITRLKERLMPAKKRSLYQQVAIFLERPGNEYPVSRLLSANFTEKHFTKIRRLADDESARILNYLIKDGKNLMAALVRKYRSLLKSKPLKLTENQAVTLLQELYWKCILDIGYHNGSPGGLRKLFKAAVYATFNLPNTDTVEIFANRGAVISLPNVHKITADKLFLLIEQGIRMAPDMINVEGELFGLDEFILTGLETRPALLLSIIKKIPVSDKRIEVLNKAISFDRFCLLIANGAGNAISDALTALRMLYVLTDRITSGRIAQKLVYSYWVVMWNIICTNNPKPAQLQSLVAETMYHLAAEKHVNSDFILSEIGKLPFQFNHTLKSAFVGYNSAFAVLLVNETKKLSGRLRKIRHKGLLYNLSYHIITNKHVPLCFFYADEQRIADTLNEIIAHDPINLLIVFKQEMIPEQQMVWLHDNINFQLLINSVTTLNQNRSLVLNDLGQFYKIVGKVSIPGISVREIRYILFRKLMVAWASDNWTAISGERLWNELIWDLCLKREGSKQKILHASEKIIPLLPLSLQAGFKKLMDQEKKLIVIKTTAPKPLKTMLPSNRPVGQAREGIHIKNAGLVLVNNYAPVLLERLGLIKDRKFVHTEGRDKAVHYLQYVVTGLNITEEYLLPLNKVMCGLPVMYPVDCQIDITEEERNIIDGLIKAMIAHWPSIGEHTINGFRGNWLVRDGVLTELDDKWELKVEKRAYDILLNKSPFSFSVIKYPWMDKPIHVTWSY